MARAPGKTPPPDKSGEERIIDFFRPLARHPGALSLDDDAAFVAPPAGCDLVLKTDAIVGGVHFLADDPPDAVARKALRVNLSDLAAKGAKPFGFLLALAIPHGVGPDWLGPFARALGADAREFGCPLFGGDTDRTPGPVTISIAALGTLPHGSMVRRSGARPGDRVFVTGTIGDAVLGLTLERDLASEARLKLDAAKAAYLVDRYRVPRPRLKLADALRAYASAAMDVSDGLVGDFAKLCRASGVSAVVAARDVPLSEAARAALKVDASLLPGLLTGGDDYEIVCTVTPERAAAFVKAAKKARVPLAEIGEIVSGEAPPRFLDREGKEMAFARTAYSHF